MSDFPYVEDIYDMETSQLEVLLQRIEADVASEGKCQIPDRFDSFEKYRKKALKLKEHLELELEERGQFDDVLNFFLGTTASSNSLSGPSHQATASPLNFLDDDQFYKPLTSSTAAVTTAPLAVQPPGSSTATASAASDGLTQEE